MADQVSTERLYLTADGTRVVTAGDPDAASLFVAEGMPVSDADIEKYDLEEYVAEAPPPYDAAADHAAKHNPPIEEPAPADQLAPEDEQQKRARLARRRQQDEEQKRQEDEEERKRRSDPANKAKQPDADKDRH
jgi:hypothetical protein